MRWPMRWKWRLRFLFIVAIELPILVWLGTTINVSGTTLLVTAGGLTAFLLAMRIMRPTFFVLIGGWLFGIAGGSWYLQSYLPPSLAFASAAVLSTFGCAVASPIYLRVLGVVLRRQV
jgi:hypothetical protein